LTQGIFRPGWVALVLAVAMAGAFLMFFAHKSTPYAAELWWQFAVDERAPRAMRAGLVASLVLLIGTIVFALRPQRLSPSRPTEEDMATASAIIANQPDASAFLALTGDKVLMFSESRDAFIMYGVHGRSWIALGDPVGPEASARNLAWTFADAARAANCRPVFYQVGEEQLPLWIDMGLTLHKLGEEAVVDLTTFGLEGSAHKKLRSAHSRSQRDGLTFKRLSPPHRETLVQDLKVISDAWLSEKHVREKSFSVGRFDEAYLQRSPIAAIYADDKIVAFANILSTLHKDQATIDLMRHRGDAPAGTMEFLFVELMLALKQDGYQSFNLGMAPLAGFETRRGTRFWNKFGAALYRHGGEFYNFDGLRRFKDKFDPAWHPKYLACSTRLPPVMPLADVSIMIAGGIKGVVSK